MSEGQPDRYRELLRAHAEDCWSGGVYEHLDERFTFDVAFVNVGRELRGTDEIRAHVESIRERLQDLQLSTDEVVTTGSTATVYWTCRGTLQDEAMSGEQVTFGGKAHVTFGGDRISMVHGFPNQLQVLRAAGGLI